MRKKTEPTRLEVVEGTEPFRTLNLLDGPSANVDEMILCTFTKPPDKKKSLHKNKDSVDPSTSKKEKSESKKRKISNEKDEFIKEKCEDLDILTKLDNMNGSMSTPNSVEEKLIRRFSSRITTANTFSDQDGGVNKNTKKKIGTSTPKQKSSTKNFKSYLKSMNSDFDEISPTKMKEVNSEEKNMNLKGERKESFEESKKILKSSSSGKEIPSKKRKISNGKDELIKEKCEDLDILTKLDNVNGSISTPNSVEEKLIRRFSSRITAANRFSDQDRNVNKNTEKKIGTSTPKQKSSTKNFKSYLKSMNSDFDEISPTKMKEVNSEEKKINLKGKRKESFEESKKVLKSSSSDKEHPSKKRKTSNEKDELIKEQCEDLDILTRLDNVNGSKSSPNNMKEKQIRRFSNKKGIYRERNSKGQFLPVDKDKRNSSSHLNSCLISEKKQSPKKNCSVSFNLTENSDTLTSQNNMNGNLSTSNNVEEKQIRVSLNPGPKCRYRRRKSTGQFDKNSDTLTSQNNMNGNLSTSNNVEEKQIRVSLSPGPKCRYRERKSKGQFDKNTEKRRTRSSVSKFEMNI